MCTKLWNTMAQDRSGKGYNFHGGKHQPENIAEPTILVDDEGGS